MINIVDNFVCLWGHRQRRKYAITKQLFDYKLFFMSSFISLSVRLSTSLFE